MSCFAFSTIATILDVCVDVCRQGWPIIWFTYGALVRALRGCPRLVWWNWMHCCMRWDGNINNFSSTLTVWKYFECQSFLIRRRKCVRAPRRPVVSNWGQAKNQLLLTDSESSSFDIVTSCSRRRIRPTSFSSCHWIPSIGSLRCSTIHSSVVWFQLDAW